jgi:hypothetical protein
MKTYEVTFIVVVQANDEDDAEQRQNDHRLTPL